MWSKCRVRFDLERGDQNTGDTADTGSPEWVKKGPRKASRNSLLAAAVSEDGRYLAVGGGDKRVHVWDIRSHEYIQVYVMTPYFSKQTVNFSFIWLNIKGKLVCTRPEMIWLLGSKCQFNFSQLCGMGLTKLQKVCLSEGIARHTSGHGCDPSTKSAQMAIWLLPALHYMRLQNERSLTAFPNLQKS